LPGREQTKSPLRRHIGIGSAIFESPDAPAAARVALAGGGKKAE
jgi:hypothetical protein